MQRDLLPESGSARRVAPVTPPPAPSASSRRPAALMALAYGAHFLGFGVQLPYLPVWLASKGLDPVTIGLILSVQIGVRIVVTAPLTALADTRLGPLRLLRLCDLVACLAFAGLLFADGALAIGLLVALSAVALAPIVPLCDLVTLAAARTRAGIDYGMTRNAGSAAFLLGNLACGALLGVLDPAFIVIALAGCAALAALSTGLPLPIPRVTGTDASVKDQAGDFSASRPIVVPASRSCLALIVAGAAIAQASHAMLYSFGALHWQRQGYDGTMIGAFWAIGIITEMILFARLGRHVGAVGLGFRLMAAGAVLGAMRFTLMAFDPPLAMAVLLQVLHGGSFGAVHLGTMSLMSALAPDGARAVWQGRLAAVTALALALATAASGPLYRAVAGLAYLGMVPLGLVGLTCILAAWRLYPHKAGEGGNTRLPS